MDSQNFYERLGVPRNATTEEIRSKWKKLIKQAHPDTVKKKMPSATEEEIAQAIDAANNFTQLINEAYETLRKPASREQYDAKLRYEEANNPKPRPNTTPSHSNRSRAPFNHQRTSQASRHSNESNNADDIFNRAYRNSTQRDTENFFRNATRKEEPRTDRNDSDNVFKHAYRNPTTEAFRAFTKQQFKKNQQRPHSAPEDNSEHDEGHNDSPYNRQNGNDPFHAPKDDKKPSLDPEIFQRLVRQNSQKKDWRNPQNWTVCDQSQTHTVFNSTNAYIQEIVKFIEANKLKYKQHTDIILGIPVCVIMVTARKDVFLKALEEEKRAHATRTRMQQRGSERDF